MFGKSEKANAIHIFYWRARPRSASPRLRLLHSTTVNTVEFKRICSINGRTKLDFIGSLRSFGSNLGRFPAGLNKCACTPATGRPEAATTDVAGSTPGLFNLVMSRHARQFKAPLQIIDAPDRRYPGKFVPEPFFPLPRGPTLDRIGPMSPLSPTSPSSLRLSHPRRI
jgi:hypothetical protein